MHEGETCTYQGRRVGPLDQEWTKVLTTGNQMVKSIETMAFLSCNANLDLRDTLQEANNILATNLYCPAFRFIGSGGAINIEDLRRTSPWYLEWRCLEMEFGQWMGREVVAAQAKQEALRLVSENEACQGKDPEVKNQRDWRISKSSWTGGGIN